MMNSRASARILVLTNLNLLYSIFVFVSESRATPARTSDKAKQGRYLAGCKTVCRTFYEPAIILWSKLYTFLPLWHLLAPPDADVQLNFLSELLSTDRDKLSECLYKVSTVTLCALVLLTIPRRSFLRSHMKILLDGIAFCGTPPVSVKSGTAPTGRQR